MNCRCDWVQADSYYESHPVSIKSYTCDECGETIPIGTMYQKVRGRWDGVFVTIRTCEFCERVSNDLYTMGFCPPHNGLWEYIHEELEGFEV